MRHRLLVSFYMSNLSKSNDALQMHCIIVKLKAEEKSCNFILNIVYLDIELFTKILELFVSFLLRCGYL